MKSHNWLSVILSTFAGASLSWLQLHLVSVPQSGQEWAATIAGGALAGAIAVTHLFQPSPAP